MVNFIRSGSRNNLMALSPQADEQALVLYLTQRVLVSNRRRQIT